MIIAGLFEIMTIADYDGGGHMDWGGGWWIVMVLGMILFWGLLGMAIYALAKGSGSRRNGGQVPGSDDALTILDRRLAEGGISTEEYQEHKALLTGSGPGDSTKS